MGVLVRGVIAAAARPSPEIVRIIDDISQQS
jgi:hypothetical protein